MKKREQLSGVVFTRFICAIGIILFHFSCHSKSSFKILYKTANGGWGNIIVVVFFVISGLVLYYNYKELNSFHDICIYIYKRWKAIFPMFYCVYLYFFVRKTIDAHQFPFISGPPRGAFLLTIFGVDGYFYYRGVNYYIIGEWFLGAIVFLYLLYPLILILKKKVNWFVLFSMLFILFIYVLEEKSIFVISTTRNLITCLISFCFGIFVGEYLEIFQNKKWVFVISLIVFFTLSFVDLYINNEWVTAVTMVQGYSLCVILFRIGSMIMRMPILSTIIKRISKISFPIFLTHHIVISDLLGINDPVDVFGVIYMAFFCVCLSVISARIITILVDQLFGTKLFNIFEKGILSYTCKDK